MTGRGRSGDRGPRGGRHITADYQLIGSDPLGHDVTHRLSRQCMSAGPTDPRRGSRKTDRCSRSGI